MVGQLLLRTAVVLWLAQIVCTTGYGANFGGSNGQASHPQANKPQYGGGAHRMLIPSRGHKAGVHKGYGTYPAKSQGMGPTAGVSGPNGANTNGYGPAAHATNGGKMKGYGAAAAGTVNGQGDRSQGKRPDVSAGEANGHQMKGYGAAGVLGGNGQGATGVKGQGVPAGRFNVNGVGNAGQGGAGKPMKGYGNPIYGAGMGNPRNLNRNQGKAYGRHGYNNNGAQPLGGYNNGYGHAGLSLGPRYGNKGIKGPQQGSRAVAGQGSKPNGYAGGRHGGHGAVPNGYGYTQGGNPKPVNPAFGSYLNGYGNKNKGYGGSMGGGARPHPGFGFMPNGKNMFGASNGNAFKGGVFSPAQPSTAPHEADAHQFSLSQGKRYTQTPIIPQEFAEPEPIFSQGSDPTAALESTPQPALTGSEVKAQKVSTPGAGPVVPQSNVDATSNRGYVTGSAVPENKSTQTDLVGLDSTAEVGVFPETVAANGEAAGVPEPEVTADGTNIQSQPVPGADSLPAGQSETTEASVTKGQGTKSAKPDCGPSGVPNGQWMKIRPGYNGGAGTQTKGYRAGAGVQSRHGAKPHDGASAGAASHGGGSKASMSGYHPGGYNFPALANGYGAGVQYPYAGNVQQPGYGQGSYLGAAYGNPYAGSKNGQNAGVQPDYAGLVQGDPNAEAKSGVPQLPFNGFPMVPAGLDGMSQLKPQSAGLGPNGKSDTYGGMAGVHFGGQAAGMGVEKSSKKYGIGGLQFGGQPYNGNGGASRFGYAGGPYEPRADGKSFGKYGHGGFPTSGQHFGLGANGPVPGQYGYGRIPYEAQPAGVSHEYKPAGKYGQSGASYQPEAPGLGHAGQVGSKHDNMGAFNVQPLESAPVTTAEGDSLPFETLPSEPDAVGTLFGEQPTPADAVEAEGKSVYGYDDAGFINGQVQPQVAASPAAPSPSPSLASVVSDVVPGGEDLPDIVDGTDLDSATGFQGVAKMDEETEDMQQQQLPRQIHIKQHLKLHFHPQGAKNNK